MSKYRNLIVWQKAMVLVTNIYRITNNFPKEEAFGLTSQIRRSAISIPSNIAEGYGRNGDIELVRFLNIASGSLYELQTQLEISRNIGYINDENFNAIYTDTREVEVMIVSLISKIKLTK